MKKSFLILASALMLMTTLCSCAGEKTSEENEAFVSEFLNAYHSKSENASVYLANDAFNFDAMSYDGIQGLIAEKIEYNILKSDSDSVTVEINGISFQETFEAVVADCKTKSISDDEAVYSALAECIKNGNAVSWVYECVIPIESVEDERSIVLTEDLSIALTGGFFVYINELTGGIGNETN